eukprot:gene3330-6014_t
MDPPRNVQAFPGQNCTIKVIWERPTGIKAYSFRLYMRKAGEDDTNWQRIAQDKDLLSFTTNQLEPITSYEFRVQSYGIQGDGKFSSVVCATTAAKGIPISTESITVSWNPPNKPNGEITAYLLYFDQCGQDTFVELELDGTATSYEAHYLHRDTVYRFQICAVNAAGESPLSPILNVRTLQDSRSRFLKIKPEEPKPVAGTKAAYIRDFPGINSHEESGKDDHDGNNDSYTKNHFCFGEQVDSSQSLVSKTPHTEKLLQRDVTDVTSKDWKPQFPRSKSKEKEKEVEDEKQLRQALAEEEKLKQLRRKREQLERVKQMESVFQTSIKETMESQEERLRKLKVVPTTGAPLSGGVSIQDEYQEISRAQKEAEARYLESQLMSSTDEDSISDNLMSVLKGGRALKSLSGTIRGKKHAVRTALETFSTSKRFESELLDHLYNEEKNNQIVIYVTSVAGVRSTYDACQHMLRLHITDDVIISERFALELRERLPTSDQVPQAFVNFFHLGGLERVIQLNETGELKKMLINFEDRTENCQNCGGKGFIPCSWCFGSKKSISNKFAEGYIRNLKCTVCNENGLQRCPSC